VSLVKKLNQIVYVWFAGAYADAVNVNRTKQFLQLTEPLGVCAFVLSAETAARRINSNCLTGFSVRKFDNPCLWQRQFSRVAYGNRNAIVPFVQ